MKPYLYILIAIVYFIYNAYKNSQKKSSPNTSDGQPMPQEKESDIKTLLEEIIMGKEKAQPITPPQPQEIIIQEPISNLNFNKEKQAKTNYKEAKEKRNFNFTEEEIKEKSFDLRQAIIYSEILKRPQY